MVDEAKRRLGEKLAALRKIYLQNAPEKITKLEDLLLKMEGEPVETSILNDLYETVHKLHGTAGSYGLGRISEIAGDWERLLKTIRADPADTGPSRLEEMRGYFEAIKKPFQEASEAD